MMAFPSLGSLRADACPETHGILRCALQVHQWLGGGHPRTAYLEALAWEFHLHGIGFWRTPFAPGHPADFVCAPGVVAHLAPLDSLEAEDEADLREALEAARVPVALVLDFGQGGLRVRRVEAGAAEGRFFYRGPVGGA